MWPWALGADKKKWLKQTICLLMFQIGKSLTMKVEQYKAKGSHCKYEIQTVIQDCFIKFLEWSPPWGVCAVNECFERRHQRHNHKELFVYICLEFVQADKLLLHVNYFNETVSLFLILSVWEVISQKLIQSQDSWRCRETNCTADRVGTESKFSHVCGSQL